jgi:hypothetical protein
LPLLPLLLVAFSVGAVAGSAGSLNFFGGKNKKLNKNSLFFFSFSFCVCMCTLSIWLSSDPSIYLSRFRQTEKRMIFVVVVLLLGTFEKKSKLTKQLRLFL